MSEIVDEKVLEIEKGQKNIEKQLLKVQNTINTIEKDIYEDNFETEIVCPYCNNEFSAEINDEEENEIECPECHNIIEIDLNSDLDEDLLGCSGNCSSCGGCSDEEEIDEEDL